MNIDTRIKAFFLVFGTVYFLESIGGFYMTSAVVFIERQFQIPSEMSGTMVSAGDFAYIPVVIFTSYYGGKGNRARWIGGGCILIAIANLLIASSNFLFPVEEHHVNSSYIKNSLGLQVNRDILDGENQMDWFNKDLDLLDPEGIVKNMNIGPAEEEDYLKKYQVYCFYHNTSDVCKQMEEIVGSKYNTTAVDVSVVRVLSSLPYAFCHNDINLLRLSQKLEECAKQASSFGPFTMIFSGLLILGVGRTMPFSLGLPLIDDNVKKKNLPVYFGEYISKRFLAFMFFVKILGPVIGLLVGAQLNKIYYKFTAPQGLTPYDPMWIGCWWLGFVIFGCVLFFPSLALFLFPAEKLKDKKEEMELMSENDGEKKAVIPRKTLHLRDKHLKADQHRTTEEQLHEFIAILKALIWNPIYVGAALGRIVDVLAFKGFFVFLSKYLEIQFGMPQHKIQIYVALSGVVGFAMGVMCGSITMKKLRLQGRRAAGWVAVCSLMAACMSFGNGLVGCKSVTGELADQAKLNIANNRNFFSCRPDCVCDGMPFYPVCNSRGDVFFSPCHAGCPLGGANYTIYSTDPSYQPDKKLRPLFTDCECAGTEDLEMSRDHCDSGIGAFFGGLSVVPGMLILLRAVPPEHRSISLGFNGFLVSLFATLPSPIFWGMIFDTTCVVWQDVCSKLGACSLYDSDTLRVRIHLIYGGLRLFSLLSDIWVFYWAKGLKIMDEEDEVLDEKEQETEEERLKDVREGKEDNEDAKSVQEMEVLGTLVVQN